MSSPALSAAASGIRYQIRFFWLHALPMLTDKGVARVEMEHGKTSGVDDIAVFYTSPGKNDCGEMTDADFFQAKYHVDQRDTIDTSFFTDPTRTNTAESLIKRFADAWSNVRSEYPNCRLTFFTTWQWDSTDPLLACIKESGYLNEDFFSKGINSKVGKARKQLQRASGLDGNDFAIFAKRLRFYVPWPTFQLEGNMRDRMQIAGLEPPPLEREYNALDGLGSRLLETGRVKWNKEELYDLLKREGLLAKSPLPRHPILSVRSFTRFSGLGLQSGDIDIDLTDLFNGRFPYSSNAWSEQIPARLGQWLSDIAVLQQPIELALDCHLSIAWNLGMLLDSKSGVQTIIRQRSNERGTELWIPTLNTEIVDEWIMEENRDGGKDLVVIASLTHPTKDDVLRSLPSLGLTEARIIHFTHPSPSNNAVRDGSHALSLARSLSSKIRDALSKEPCTRVHLFFSAPVSFAFLLGQNSGVIGPATVYEYDFKGTKTYSRGMSSTAV